MLYELMENNLTNGTVSIEDKLYDVVNKVDLKFIYLFDVTDREKLKIKY